MTSRRSRAREVALQLLFQFDLNPKPIPRGAVEAFVRERLLDDEMAAEFCLTLFDGIMTNRDTLDAQISATAENWKLHRMLPVDRNVLRLCAYEMQIAKEPTAVAIDEAIKLSRRFGSLDSPAFVNGILDKIAKPQPVE